tara:strand:- start:1507 stop:3363 length:1857 start_codon:yes stop_codon:yes gene_type:complete
MSYLDQLDSFSSDLNQQHEQMTASLGAVGQRLQEQFNEEFNKTIEQMELAGGAVSTAGLGLAGVNKSYKGFKMWKDARVAKAEKLKADFEARGRAAKADLEAKAKGASAEVRDITGAVDEDKIKFSTGETADKAELEDLKAEVAENNRVGKVETEQKFVNEDDGVSQGAKVEDTEGGAEADLGEATTSLPTTGAEAEEGAVNQFLGGVEEGGSSVAEDVAKKASIDARPPRIKGVPEGDFMETSSFGSSADQTIGGSTNTNGYNFEADGLFDKPHHSGRFAGAESIERALGDGVYDDPKPLNEGQPEFIRETRTTKQLLPPENTRMRSGTASGDLLEGDKDNVRVGPSTDSNVREIETTLDRANPNYREPTLGEGNKIGKGKKSVLFSEEVDGPEVIADPPSKLADPYQTVQLDDPLTQPFNTVERDTGGNTPLRTIGDTGDYKGGTLAEGGDTRATGGAGGELTNPVANPDTSARGLRVGDVPPDQLPLDSRGLGVNVGNVEAGGVESAEVGGTVVEGAVEGALEKGGVKLGTEIGAEAGIGLFGELGAMGVGSVALGSLGPVAEVVGAGFMIAGLVNDLQSDPHQVAKTLAGGVSGKVGFDPSSVGGGGSAGMGII